MDTRRSFGLIFVLIAVAGLTCRWEEWDCTDRAGASVFRYRGVVAPWQEVRGPVAGGPATTVAVRKWSYYGFNRSDYTGPPPPATEPPVRTAAGGSH